MNLLRTRNTALGLLLGAMVTPVQAGEVIERASQILADDAPDWSRLAVEDESSVLANRYHARVATLNMDGLAWGNDWINRATDGYYRDQTRLPPPPPKGSFLSKVRQDQTDQ